MLKINIENINKSIIINNDSQHIAINNLDIIINYVDLIDINLIETKGAIGKSGIARAFTSSFLGDQSYVVTSLKLEILTNVETYCLELIKTPLKSNTIVYKKIRKDADEALEKLKAIAPLKLSSSYGYIDEIRELKKLLDENIITQEEFNLKKHDLLNKN